MNYGVIGEHLPHSFSKIIHEKIESYSYIIREVAKEELDSFMREKDFQGINVTIPYKEAVIPHLDFIDPMAKAIGAVNTVVNENGKLYGYNTDFKGMRALISRIGLSLSGKKVLILGTGGTSKTAKALANAEGAASVYRISYFESEDAISYKTAYECHADADILINTTPCGMFPKIDTIATDENGAALDLARFPHLEGVVDVVYNPLRTRLVQEAEGLKLPAQGGLYMLVAQAVFAAEYFTKKTYPTSLIDEIFNEIVAKKENIVLIGMPASGKTTVGKLLADRTGRRLVDTDEEIVALTGKDIPTVFREEGESAFRDYESRVIASLATEENLVIATGGGAILKAENCLKLKHNGSLYFLDRPLDSLIPTADRPTASSREAITARYHERYPIYTAVCDHRIDASAMTPDEVASAILIHHERKD